MEARGAVRWAMKGAGGESPLPARVTAPATCSAIVIVVTPIERVEWARELPPVDAVRPARCPGCGKASRLPGRRLGLHGHGVRTRDLWGPPKPGSSAALGELRVRRYRCVHCLAVCTVVPRGLLRRHLYTAGAIALALSLWSMGLAATAVRARISPWPVRGHARGWRSLHRWTDRPRWPVPGLPPDRVGRAGRIAGWLAAHAIASAATADLPILAFAGAQLARGRAPPPTPKIGPTIGGESAGRAASRTFCERARSGRREETR